MLDIGEFEVIREYRDEKKQIMVEFRDMFGTWTLPKWKFYYHKKYSEAIIKAFSSPKWKNFTVTEAPHA
jgi:hypothetical protein